MNKRPGKTAKRERRERALARWEFDLVTNDLPHQIEYIKRQIANIRKNLGKS
jgi:hypothetical protein